MVSLPFKRLWQGLTSRGKVERCELPQQDYETLIQKVESSLTSLSTQVEKLRLRYNAMIARSKEYFEKCIEALTVNDVERAKMYADEIAGIRKLADIVVRCSLFLEQIKIRLETILELKEVIGLMVPLISIIEAVESEISRVVPEASSNLRELANLIEDFISTSSTMEIGPGNEVEVSIDAKMVLEEAKRCAAEVIKKSFPEVPSLTDEERLVYSYIMKGVEELDVNECAKELGLERFQVENALRNLQEKGLIEVQIAERT